MARDGASASSTAASPARSAGWSRATSAASGSRWAVRSWRAAGRSTGASPPTAATGSRASACRSRPPPSSRRAWPARAWSTSAVRSRAAGGPSSRCPTSGVGTSAAHGSRRSGCTPWSRSRRSSRPPSSAGSRHSARRGGSPSWRPAPTLRRGSRGRSVGTRWWASCRIERSRGGGARSRSSVPAPRCPMVRRSWPCELGPRSSLQPCTSRVAGGTGPSSAHHCPRRRRAPSGSGCPRSPERSHESSRCSSRAPPSSGTSSSPTGTTRWRRVGDPCCGRPRRRPGAAACRAVHPPNATTPVLVGTKSRPSAGVGVAKCSTEPTGSATRSAPVSGSRP